MLAWSSQEQYVKLKKSMPDEEKQKKRLAKMQQEQPEERVFIKRHDDGVPASYDRFRNEEGEIDMRKMTGKQALAFLRAQGIRIPVIPKVR